MHFKASPGLYGKRFSKQSQIMPPLTLADKIRFLLACLPPVCVPYVSLPDRPSLALSLPLCLSMDCLDLFPLFIAGISLLMAVMLEASADFTTWRSYRFLYIGLIYRTMAQSVVSGDIYMCY